MIYIVFAAIAILGAVTASAAFAGLLFATPLGEAIGDLEDEGREATFVERLAVLGITPAMLVLLMWIYVSSPIEEDKEDAWELAGFLFAIILYGRA